MNVSASIKSGIAAFTLVILTAAPSWAYAAQNELTAEIKQLAMECRAERNECFKACNFPSRQLERGREVSDADIQACRDGHSKMKQPAKTEPAWTPEYATMPDVVGVFRGALVAAQGRNDWKRYCGSSAIIGDNQKVVPLGIPKGATVRVSGIRYVTNPVRDFSRISIACRAERIEVVATP